MLVYYSTIFWSIFCCTLSAISISGVLNISEIIWVLMITSFLVMLTLFISYDHGLYSVYFRSLYAMNITVLLFMAFASYDLIEKSIAEMIYIFFFLPVLLIFALSNYEHRKAWSN